MSITRSVAGQEIVESQDPSSMGRENKGNEKWGRDSEWEGSFQGRGKKKAMFLMEGKREAEIVESGGVGVFGRNSYLQFFISVILMGLHTWLPAYVLRMADVMSVVSLHESGHTI